ncbi:hypothetical protein, partial [Anaplasma marginale]|uniref:hypothetical protein n=1 Tax=Anaplasma marginale TaxID=770 RepID=UPI0005B4EA8D
MIPKISNVLGEPATSSTFYFPLEHFIDTLNFFDTTIIQLDTFSVRWFSEQLHFMDEPILYNYFLDKQIYRLTWLRSFHPDIVLRFENRNGEIALIQKKLTLIDPWKRIDSVTMVYDPDEFDLKERTKKLNLKLWTQFELLLKQNQ